MADNNLNGSQNNMQPNQQAYQNPNQPPYQAVNQPNYQGSNPADVQSAVTAAMEEQKKKKRKKRLIILAIIIALIIVICVAASSGSSDSDSSTTQAAGQTTSAVKAENGNKNAKAGEIGDYVCTVKSAKICKDWEGKDSVLITYSFTNNSSEAQSFDLALTDNVYQDGVGLESSFISSDGEDDDWGVDVKIKPGTTKEVRKVYKLRDTKTPLEVEVGELFSFDDTKVTTTVELKK